MLHLFIGEEVLVAIEIEKYVCPYCDRQSASPGGVRFHVRSEHPEKLQEFMENIYPEMAERYKKAMAAE